MIAYWIKGDDGEEYGPAELNELRSWLLENRVGPETLVRPAGGDEPWRSWQQFPELVSLFKEVFPLSSASAFPVASYSSRFAAFVVDTLILALLFLFAVFALYLLSPASYQADLPLFTNAFQNDNGLDPAQMRFLFVAVLMKIVYFTYFHARTGQTPGKRLFGIQVADRNGSVPSFSRSFVRALAALFSEATYGMGYLLIFFTPGRRALHDLIAGTVVKRAK